MWGQQNDRITMTGRNIKRNIVRWLFLIFICICITYFATFSIVYLEKFNNTFNKEEPALIVFL